MTGELREAIENKIDINIDEKEAYVAYYEVHDDRGADNVRFLIIWTTRKIESRRNEVDRYN